MSRRNARSQTIYLPGDADYSAPLIREMIRKDAEIGFDIQVPDGENFAEVSMRNSMMRTYQQAQQPHPSAANLPPMRIFERGMMEHFIAVLKGDVDPQQR